MKKSSKTSKINRSLGVKAVLVLLLVALWGCDMRPETTWAEHRSVMYVSGILDDSLALVVTGREWWVDDPLTMGLGPGYSDDGYSNFGINIVNYREKKASIWLDSVDFSFGASSLLDNKSIVFADKDGFGNSMFIWTLYHKNPKKITYKWEPIAGCESVSAPNTARPWLSGNIALLPKSLSELNDSCGFALLDTATGEVSTFYAKGEWQWLRSCKDIKAFGNRLFCVSLPPSGIHGIDIFAEGGLVDSFRIDLCPSMNSEKVKWSGDYIDLRCSKSYPYSVDYKYLLFDQRDGTIQRNFYLVTVNSNRWGFITDRGQISVVYEGGDL